MKQEIRTMLEFGVEEYFPVLTTHNNQPAISIKGYDNAFEILCQGIGHVLTNIKEIISDADLGFVVTAEEFALACNNLEICYEGRDLIVWGGCEKKRIESTPSNHDKNDTFKLLAAAVDANAATRNYYILYNLVKNMIVFGSDIDFFHAVGLCVMQFETYAKQINTSQTLEEFAANIEILSSKSIEVLFSRKIGDSQVSYYFNQ